MKKAVIGMMAGVLCVGSTNLALATPSTQIWIPSTDIQTFKVAHLGLDNYVRSSHKSDGTRDPNVYDAGLTVGVLPFTNVQAEVGADYLVNGTAYDDDPFYFNAKIGTPEDALFTCSPALAIGSYNFGTNSKKSSATRTDQNIVYGLAARTLPVLGRLSAGYYFGNDKVLPFTQAR